MTKIKPTLKKGWLYYFEQTLRQLHLILKHVGQVNRRGQITRQLIHKVISLIKTSENVLDFRST